MTAPLPPSSAAQAALSPVTISQFGRAATRPSRTVTADGGNTSLDPPSPKFICFITKLT